MALIGKIRQKTGLLLGFIGLALILFLLEAGLSQNSLMGGARKNLGKINGKKVDTQEYIAAVSAYSERIKVLNPNLQMNDENSAAIRDEVWNEFISNELLGETFKDLGLTVTDEEIAENFKGENIHPFVMNLFAQSFTNPQTGQFDKAQFAQALGTMDQIDPSGQFRNLVTQLELLLKDERVRTKYGSLVAKSSYMPSFLAKDNLESNQSLTANVLSVPYTSIDDAKVAVTDAEIAAYIKKYPKRFKQAESRVIDLVTFDLKASPEDVDAIRNNLLALAEEFKTTTEDSLFMVRNTVQGSKVEFLTAAEIGQNRPYADAILATPTGEFYGPYEDGEMLIMTRVVDRKQVPDSVRASHILLKYTSREDRDVKRKMADSIIADVKAGRVSFPQKAFEISEDPGSKQQGGDLGFFAKGAMVPEFNDKVFYNMSVGEIATVESQFGLHIILKTGQSGAQTALRLADIVLDNAPSDATVKTIYDKAYSFWQKSSTADAFDKNAKSQNVRKNIAITSGDAAVAGLPSSRKVISWAFQEEEPGAIQFFDMDNSYGIAKLVSFKEKGTKSVADVKDEVTEILRKEKKAELIAKKLEPASKGTTDLNAIAAKVQGTVLPATIIQYSQDFIPSLGSEPKLVGTAFGVAANKVSKPVSGNNGVFLVQPLVKTPNDMAGMDVEMYKTQVAKMMAGRITFQTIIDNLKEKVEIKDERFYIY